VRRRETAQGESTAPGRRRFRSSQSLDQLLNQAEYGEDRHRQHDEYHYGHTVSNVYGSPDFGALIQDQRSSTVPTPALTVS
jgi:hypothetical protein